MALWPAIDDSQAGPAVRAVFDDIRATRGSDTINDIWRVLANDPALLRRTWEQVKAVMAPGALDGLTKELVYLAVSITNNCEYCTHTHAASARDKGMTEEAIAADRHGVVQGDAQRGEERGNGLRARQPSSLGCGSANVEIGQVIAAPGNANPGETVRLGHDGSDDATCGVGVG